MKNDRKDNRAWVSASKAGRAQFCPHYLELERNRADVSKRAAAARIKGDRKHDALNRKAEDKRCYVASHLYGIDDSRTNLLRAFRDNRLKDSIPGQLFIGVYYRLSPMLVVLAKRSKLVEKVLSSIVDKIVRHLQEKKSDG
jgi:hypothetical protein